MYTAQYGTASDDYINAITIDLVRGVGYLIGTTLGSAPGFANAGVGDALVIAFHLSNGTLLYYFQVGTSVQESASAMAIRNANYQGYLVGSQGNYIMLMMFSLNATDVASGKSRTQALASITTFGRNVRGD